MPISGLIRIGHDTTAITAVEDEIVDATHGF